ncbi:MAG: hypothetical protein ACFFER_19365, partial [Candidatus Thorarchaeota archaeon]
VATLDIGQPIDLSSISKQPFISYDPSRYFCAYFKDDTMEAKVSIFTSGKLIAVGAKSEKSAKRDLMHTMGMLHRSMKTKDNVGDITIRNVVITVDLGHDIDLEILQANHSGAIYEPEQFPGAVMRSTQHDASVLAFATGKLVIAGLKSTKSMTRIVEEVVEELGLA